MRKIRLNVEELVVEGFATSSVDAAGRGTVRAASGNEGCTFRWDVTCVELGSCQVMCDATLVEPTCPGESDC